MLDFTSALFLGWRHPARGPDWPTLTTGRPAALDEPPAAPALAARIAARQGAEAGVVHRSALHGLWDAVATAVPSGGLVLVDEASYPLAVAACAAALTRGAQVRPFRHHDVADLVERADGRRGPIVAVTDGWCPGCNRPAPLPDLEAAVRARGGVLLVDDTQAAGVLGHDPGRGAPFGTDGAGTVRWLGSRPGSAVQVSSLAKGYGAPLAVTTGPAAFVRPLRSRGTRWHASPPTAADLAAASAATADERRNDRLRERLARLVARLRDGLARLGLRAVGWPFPLVSVPVPARTGRALLRRLAERDIRILLTVPRCRPSAVAVTWAVTARHRRAEIDRVLDVVSDAAWERTIPA
ncbi:MAG TPA: aminotransferase class I/II-fold pyridoxal phosphate-dependent enzyme [Mycobacteriales bacterium]|nr:aminotransferase class I/II-fold pyridoxal phosphate-dependent enzyme [Mycobacteriales bacterium]